MRTTAFPIACALLAACGDTTPAPVTTAPSDEAAVVAAVERFFAAMAAGDTAAYRGQVVPEAMTFSVRVAPDGMGPIRMRSHAEHLAALGASTQRWQERMWEPTVMVHGPIALVWTPYDFRLDGEFSHCGIDSFELLKVDGEWKLTNAAWTAEPAGCAPGPPERAEGTDAERDAVLSTVQRMFAGMTARDTVAYAATLVPEATYFIVLAAADGTADVRMVTGAEDVASLGSSTQRYVERIREPTVLLHPPLAVVWAPYDFYMDGSFSHCGVDIFQLLKIDGVWKLTTATWTVETEGCTPAAAG